MEQKNSHLLLALLTKWCEKAEYYLLQIQEGKYQIYPRESLQSVEIRINARTSLINLSNINDLNNFYCHVFPCGSSCN